MLYNYLKTAWRSILRGRVYSLINLLGLSLGTAVVILLSLYIHDEITFDRFHKDVDRIYRPWVKEHYQGDIFFNTITPFLLGPQLKDHLPEIEQMARLTTTTVSIKAGNDISADQLYLVEPTFLDIFNFPLVEGNKKLALDDPSKVVLTQRSAKKYFGNELAIDKILSIQLGGEWIDFIVSGIAENPPSNTGFQFDLLVPFANTDRIFSPRGMTSWTNVNVETFIKLSEENDLVKLQEKVDPFIDNQVKDIYSAGEYQVGFQPLTDIHLNNDIPVGFLPVGNSRYPYILAGIALLILLLAGINFTTLAVGRSLNKAKEVGIRKTSGATRWQIMTQYWSEAILTAGISVLFGCLLAWNFLAPFNKIAEKSITLNLDFINLLYLLALVMLIGLMSGIYPSLVLASLNPINSLRGSSSMQMPKHRILKLLIGFQFALSVLLICCTLIMKNQINFMQNKNLGYDKSQTVVIPISKAGAPLSEVLEDGAQTTQLLRDILAPNLGIKGLTMSSHTFGTPGWTSIGYTDQATQTFQSFQVNGIDAQFVPLYQINLTEGRNFAEDNLADQKSVLINQAFGKKYGIKLNETLQAPFQEYRVIGICDNFNFQSLHEQVAPLVLTMDLVGMIRTASDVSFNDFPSPKISVKLAAGQIATGLPLLESSWGKITDEPYSFSFIDENINRQYRSESKLGQILTIATVLAITIACLGLFGIVTLLVSQKEKEIGIRKVLGASPLHIVWYFNKKFSLMIALACLLSMPLALFIMKKWLADFAFRITPQWWLFLLAGLITMSLAAFAITLQSLRAATNNPINSIRSE